MFLTLDILLIASFATFFYTFLSSYYDSGSFFEACCSLIDKPSNKLAALFFIITLSLKIGDTLITFYIGKLSKSGSAEVSKEMAEIATSIIFSICITGGKMDENIGICILPLALCYLQTYIHETVASMYVSARLPSFRQHHSILTCQFILFFALLFSIISYTRMKSSIIINFTIYLMQTLADCSIDIFRHIAFIYDRKNNGSSYNIFIVIKYTEFVILVIGLISKIVYLIFHHNTLYHVYSSGKKLFELITSHRKWQRMLSVIKTEVPDVTTEDLENDNICIICRGEMQVGNGKKLPCEHCLHVECLERWIAAHDKCPMCQFDLTTIISNVHDKEKIEEERQKQNNGMENLGRQIEELFNHDEEQEVYQRGNPRRIRREQQQNQQEEHEQNEQITEEIPHEDVKVPITRNERVVHHIQRNEKPKAQIKAEEPAPIQQPVNVKKVALRKIRLPDGTIVKQFVDLSKVKPKAQQNNQ